MSGHDEKPKDVLWLLAEFQRRVWYEVSGKHGNPTRTVIARLVLLALTLPVAVPILWQAFLHLPPFFLVLIALAVMIRLARWYLKR